jgi:hypothetical protein
MGLDTPTLDRRVGIRRYTIEHWIGGGQVPRSGLPVLQ